MVGLSVLKQCRYAFLLSVGTICFVLAGCSSNDDGVKPKPPTQKGVEEFSGATDAQGTYTFHSNNETAEITVQVKDQDQRPLRGMQVEAVHTVSNLIVFVHDPNNQHYPGMQIYQSGTAKSSTSALTISEDGLAQVVPILIPIIVWAVVGLETVYWIRTDPPKFELLKNDNSLQAICITGDLEDILNGFSIISAFAGGIINVGEKIQQALGLGHSCADLIDATIEEWISELVGAGLDADKDYRFCYYKRVDGDTLPFGTFEEVLAWESVTSPTTQHLNGIWGSAFDDIYASGTGGTIIHFDGSQWTKVDDTKTTENLDIPWGSGPNDVYAVGNRGTIVHYDGTNWSKITTGVAIDFDAVWGTSRSDVYVCGTLGTILHFDGTSWKNVSSGVSVGLRGIWGPSSTDVFAVGNGGAIIHFNGSSWQSVSSGTSNDFADIWGVAGNDIFAVGEKGTILHFNGIQWDDMVSGITTDLLAVWGDEWNNVYAVGTQGVILHFNGYAWSKRESGTTAPIIDAWGSSWKDVYAVGVYGQIKHLSPMH